MSDGPYVTIAGPDGWPRYLVRLHPSRTATYAFAWAAWTRSGAERKARRVIARERRRQALHATWEASC